MKKILHHEAPLIRGHKFDHPGMRRCTVGLWNGKQHKRAGLLGYHTCARDEHSCFKLFRWQFTNTCNYRETTDNNIQQVGRKQTYPIFFVLFCEACIYPLLVAFLNKDTKTRSKCYGLNCILNIYKSKLRWGGRMDLTFLGTNSITENAHSFSRSPIQHVARCLYGKLFSFATHIIYTTIYKLSSSKTGNNWHASACAHFRGATWSVKGNM